MSSGDPEAPARGDAAYGSGRVPPGAFVPRDRGPVDDPFAGAPPAEWWRRAVAAIIDAVIISIAAAIVFAIALLPLGIGQDTGSIAGAVFLTLLAIVAVAVGALLYAPMIMASTNGKTWGKSAMGCRVVRGDGRPIDVGWAAVREVAVKAIALGVAASLTGGIAYLVDILWPLVDGRKRALHDIVVDSRVVRD
ncbi:MAG TPA: RDD family protein [Solirubrobacteraceae bacterium]|jgi:uncharacterized RDD family membrane protein YckC